MKRIPAITALLTAVVFPAIGGAQAAAPVYVSVDCMKSTSPGYVQLELEMWKPVHQYLVDSGKRRSWTLYEVVFGDRSRCDYYTVTTYSGEQQLNAYADYAAAFAAVHRGADAGEQMAATMAARKHMASELWVLVDRTEIQEHRFAVINKMLATDPVAYERMESEVFKAGHQVLIDSGDRAGWAVYALVSPIGSAIPYNYGTVDFVNELGPVPMAEAMLTGNPDRDLDAMHELLGLRDHILSETWALVGTTGSGDD
ncbi:MAG: hypothetical protein QNI96_08220 [Woeseiaceae bacterium]|nr:hypothetical protein [Woeseiaceae bacterium]